MRPDALWIKICGMTDAAAVEAALAARVDAIGFVFAPSVRQLSVSQALSLAAGARTRVPLVAVTLHPSQTQIDEILAYFRPDVLQTDQADLSGLQLPASLTVLPVLRAGETLPPQLPPRLLFEGTRSGSGRVADWDQAAALARRGELILAGGLSARNVAAAIEAVRPFGVDVSSGVEVAAGRKSADKIVEFVAAARAAFHGMAHELN